MADVHTRDAQETLHATNMAPSLTVGDLEESIRFYTDGLGFGVEEEWEHEGRRLGVMLKAGNVRLGISQDDFAKGRDRVKGVGMRLWISTRQDVSELADRATAAGLRLDQGPEQTEWGAMAFTITDPDGFKLTIANESRGQDTDNG